MSEIYKIVMIDDEVDLCSVVKENLEDSGRFSVVTLSDSNRAVDFIRTHKPNLILLDIVMPGMEGSKIIDALKKDDELKRIPIIVVSGKGEMIFNKKKQEFKWTPNSKLVQNRGVLPDAKGAEALTEAYGVADYISKPFATESLIMIIDDVLEKNKRGPKISNNEDLI